MVKSKSNVPAEYRQCISCQDLYIKLDTRVPAFINQFIQFLIKFIENTFYKHELVFLFECKITRKILFGILRWFRIRLSIKWDQVIIYDSGYLPLSFSSILEIIQDIWSEIQNGVFDKSLAK
jgi:hypothetical protein